MKSVLEPVETMLTATSFESTLLHLIGRAEGLTFNAHYDNVGRTLRCTIDSNWEIHGATVNQKEISFVASKDGSSRIKYQVYEPKYLESVRTWFKEAAKQIKPPETSSLCAELPHNLIFRAGVTEFFATKKPSKV